MEGGECAGFSGTDTWWMSCHLQLLPNLSLLDTQHFPQQASAVLPPHNVKVRGRDGKCMETHVYLFYCVDVESSAVLDSVRKKNQMQPGYNNSVIWIQFQGLQWTRSRPKFFQRLRCKVFGTGRAAKSRRGVKCGSDVTGDIDVTVVRFSAGSSRAPATEDIKQRPAVTAEAGTVPESDSQWKPFQTGCQRKLPWSPNIAMITGCLLQS